MSQYDTIFSDDLLLKLLPANRADAFFEALYGEAEEGAYDISLGYNGASGDTLNFELRLDQRPGKCLACNLTYGLPQVFSRHPLINLQGVAQQVAEAAGKSSADWSLGATQEKSRALHCIPLTIELS